MPAEPCSAPCIAVLNAGSSTIKFAILSAAPTLSKVIEGSVDLATPTGPMLNFTDWKKNPSGPSRVPLRGSASASALLVQWMQSLPCFPSVQVIGHRVVHGMRHPAPARVTPALMQELRTLQPFDPEHIPLEIELIEELANQCPALPQLACFDTAFHSHMPRVATMLPIPRSYEQSGLRRYGFHGLSYTYLMEALTGFDQRAASGKVILAHLGNGCSMAAVLAGASVDTSMGFTPTSGLMMGTRCGDLDPGVISYMARDAGMTATQIDRMANHESGLLGVSQLSSDVRELLELEARDPRAAEALALFCYQARKCIGAYAAVLGGCDALVFSGGIGENAPAIRERICAELHFLGIRIDPQRNASNAALISPKGARVSVRVIHTDEEVVIARACSALLSKTSTEGLHS